MSTMIQVTEQEGQIKVIAPYNENFSRFARRNMADFQDDAYYFSLQQKPILREQLIENFGTDGSYTAPRYRFRVTLTDPDFEGNGLKIKGFVLVIRASLESGVWINPHFGFSLVNGVLLMVAGTKRKSRLLQYHQTVTAEIDNFPVYPELQQKGVKIHDIERIA